MIYQYEFLTEVLENLHYNDTTAQNIVDNLYRLRDALVSASNLGVHVTADFDALITDNYTDLNGPWKRFRVNQSSKKYSHFIPGKNCI